MNTATLMKLPDTTHEDSQRTARCRSAHDPNWAGFNFC
jgi:hypothetical protein